MVRRVLQSAELKRIRDENPDRAIFLGNGVFDFMHAAGHVAALEKMKEIANERDPKGDGLLVVSTPDARLMSENKPSFEGISLPIRPAEDRAALLAALRCVDYSFIADANDRGAGEKWPDLQYIRDLRPTVYKAGSPEDWEPYRTQIESLGVEMMYMEDMSSVHQADYLRSIGEQWCGANRGDT